MSDLVHANYGHREDGGPLGATTTMSVYIHRLRLWARSHSIEIKTLPCWGWYIDPDDLPRFRDLLASEIQEHA